MLANRGMQGRGHTSGEPWRRDEWTVTGPK